MKDIALTILSDLHFGPTKRANRVNFKKEINEVKSNIMNLTDELLDDNYDVINLALGDNFDRGVSSPKVMGEEMSWWIEYKKKLKLLASVIGNHEINFRDNNPFWYLISENGLSSKFFRERHPKQVPLGKSDIFISPDTLRVGNVVFYFNHYGCPLQIPERKEGVINIGLFHQDVQTRFALLDADKNKRNVFHRCVVDEDYFKGYDYCFFGHHHQLYGAWKTETCSYINLGSLLRNNVAEIDDRDECTIPILYFKDGIFKNLELRSFKLPRYEEIVDVEKREQSLEKYENLKERRKVLERESTSSNFETILLDKITASKNLSSYVDIVESVKRGVLDSKIKFIKGEE